VHDYTGVVSDAPATPSGLSVDRVLLPTGPRTRNGSYAKHLEHHGEKTAMLAITVGRGVP